MATPPYLAASAGRQGNAGLVAQFLGTHGTQWLYAGAVVQSQQATGTGAYLSLASGYVSQLITTGPSQTAIGSIALQVSAVGGSPLTATISPLTVGLYAAAGGLPTGPLLASAQVTEPYVYAEPFWCQIPLAATGLAPSSTYCLVASGPSTGAAYYAWQHSTQSSGTATSPDGTTWTAQPYGLMWQTYDSTASGQIRSIVADNGARVTTFTWSGTALTGISEYTIAQDGSTLTSTRTLTYAANGLITGVS
jgi:hypothetical protein